MGAVRWSTPYTTPRTFRAKIIRHQAVQARVWQLESIPVLARVTMKSGKVGGNGTEPGGRAPDQEQPGKAISPGHTGRTDTPTRDKK